MCRTKKYILTIFISFFVFALNLSAQKADRFNNLDSIIAYTNSFKQIIIEKIYEWENRWKDGKRHGVNLHNEKYYPSVSIDSIVLYPVIKISYYECKEEAICNPKIIVDSNLEICAIAYPFSKAYAFETSKKDLGFIGSSERIVRLIHRINKDAKGFCYFLDIERYQRNTLAKKDNKGNWLFYSESFKDSIPNESFLSYKYGSFEKYISLVNEESYRMKLRKEAFKNFDPQKDAKNFVKNSWQYRMEYFPNDTITNIKYLLQDINQSVSPTNKQLKLLQKKIEDRVKNESVTNYSVETSIMFMGKDISDCLGKVVNNEQFEEYKKHLKILSIRKVPVSGYLFSLESKKFANKTPLTEVVNNYKKSIIDILNN